MSNELPSPTTNSQIRWSSSLWCNHLLQQPSSWVYQRQGSGAAFKGPGSDGPWRYGDRRQGASDSGPNAEWCDLKHSSTFLDNQQFTPAQAELTVQIARARIHVEGAIQRKEFDIWHFLAHQYPTRASQIFQVCCALTNLQTPLLKEVETIWRHGKQTTLTLQIAGILSCNS